MFNEKIYMQTIIKKGVSARTIQLKQKVLHLNLHHFSLHYCAVFIMHEYLYVLVIVFVKVLVNSEMIVYNTNHIYKE